MQCCLKGSKQHSILKNLMQCCPRGSRQLCIRKMFHSMLAAYAILVLCIVVQKLQATLYKKKFKQFRQCYLINIKPLSLHMYVSGPSRERNIKLCFLHYENWLKLMLLKQQLIILPSNRSKF